LYDSTPVAKNYKDKKGEIQMPLSVSFLPE